ncbi:lipid-binding protein [Winogradskyella sp. PC-19]|uniref:YceI family protein n=1 Tax=Winogradskyella sp. PC-19 TaxID=754417 RepID=UPI000B3D2062|nr:YceI family protein [Winogradskyella sp. PC-19]ARV10368.1 lipid-binding protein [Winogradskyella sp. PC-19]
MKNLKTLTVAILALSFFSFTTMIDKKVNTEQSTVKWVGKKVTGQHEGTIKLESGSLQFDGKTLTGGNFVIDMTTITVTDLEGKGKTNLEGHLKSDDFFGVEKHGKANFTITKVNKIDVKNHEVSGDLTIKNITKPINFTMVVDVNSATAKVIVDRSKFDVRYGSPSFFNDLKDKAIYDDFELSVILSF